MGTRPTAQEIRNRRAAMYDIIVNEGEISASELSSKVDGSQPWTIREDLREIELSYPDISVGKEGKFLIARYSPKNNFVAEMVAAQQNVKTNDKDETKNHEVSVDELTKKILVLETKVAIYEDIMRACGLLTK